MQPHDLQVEQFAAYPPEAKRVALAHLDALRQLPVSFLPSLLREVIDYDFKFPAERSAIDKELTILSALKPEQMQERFQAFARLSMSSKLEDFDWINQPARFVEQESAYLWTTHQLDAFRKAATDYGTWLQGQVPPEPVPVRRLGIAVIGQGVAAYDGPLFQNLRAHGTYFAQVKAENGLATLLSAVGERAKAHPVPYGHWYVDGAKAADCDSRVTCVSYSGLEPVLSALLKNMDAQIAKPGMGPEQLRTHMAQLTPADLGMSKDGDAVLDRFRVKVLTEGSGTQIFSTTFAQWAAREALRRAQPLTLLVRFAPRQRQRPMNEMLTNSHTAPEVDPMGSLVDADMGAYYHWINQQRLPGADKSAFLAWFEGHSRALVVAPTLPRGAESNSAIDMDKLLSLALS